LNSGSPGLQGPSRRETEVLSVSGKGASLPFSGTAPPWLCDLLVIVSGAVTVVVLAMVIRLPPTVQDIEDEVTGPTVV
jgi:hypothetical protein